MKDKNIHSFSVIPFVSTTLVKTTNSIAITNKILTIPLHKSVHKKEVIKVANLLTEISKRK